MTYLDTFISFTLDTRTAVVISNLFFFFMSQTKAVPVLKLTQSPGVGHSIDAITLLFCSCLIDSTVFQDHAIQQQQAVFLAVI